MTTLDEINSEIAEITETLNPLHERRVVLHREKRLLMSRQFIAINKITRDDVEMSSGDGRPFFGHTTAFIDWLKKRGTTKRFAEWNDKIYFMSDFLAGKLTTDWTASIKELPE